MNRTCISIALATAAACASSPLLAQMSTTTAPPKAASFQISGSMTVPAFSYNDFLADIGWQAQGALILRRSPYNHIRLEGEYNYTAYEGISGGAELYGGGIGGGRVLTKGTTQTETYLVLGGYNHAFTTCIGTTCSESSEFQFGTKVGLNAVMGRGRVRPVLDIHWLSTWSAPYATLFTIGAGLRF